MEDIKYKQARELEEKYDKAILFKESLEKKAIAAYHEAADEGSVEAMYRLAIYYSNLSLTPKTMGKKDTPYFETYLKQAAEQGYEPAMFDYAEYCYNTKDYEMALMTYESLDQDLLLEILPNIVTLCHLTKRYDKLYIYLTIKKVVDDEDDWEYEEEYKRLSYIYGKYIDLYKETSEEENLYLSGYDYILRKYNKKSLYLDIDIFVTLAVQNPNDKMNKYIYHSSRHLLDEYYKKNKDELNDIIEFYKNLLIDGSRIEENKDTVVEGDFTRFSPEVGWALGYLGGLYLDGRGVNQDINKAFQMLKASYDLDPTNIDINIRLGDCYYNGYGVEPSMELAYHHYTNAFTYYDGKWYNIFNDDSLNRELQIGWSAYKCHEYSHAYPLIKKYVEEKQNNHGSLLHAYAYMNHYGLGCDINYELAAKYYQKNIDLNNASGSMCNLGLLYNDGLGVPQDYNKAYELFSKAHSLYPDTYTRYNLGRCYMYGWGVEEDYETAYSYFIQNKDTDHYLSLKYLGILYRFGGGVKQDYNKAFEYFYKVNENIKDKQSKYELARCYYYGYGTDQNKDKAFTLFKELSDENYVKAYVFVGSCYYDGYGVEIDKAKAYEYYTLANTYAKTSITLYNLGLCYEHGYGIEANKETAISLYKEALSLGSKKAKEKLEKLNVE